MTVSATTNKVQYNGNGTTTAFSYPYYFLANADIVVTTTDIATGVETVRTITTDYAVTGALSPSGGTVTFVTAPAVGTRVTIKNIVPLTQLTDLTESGPFPAETVERTFDKLTMGLQQVNEKIGRSLQLTETSSISSTVYIGEPVANNVIGWNSAGTAIENKGAFADDAASLSYIDTFSSSPSTSPSASATDSLAVGNAAVASGTRAITIGNARATGQDSLAIQNNNNTTTGATATNAIAIGVGALVSSVRGTNIGGNFNEVTTGTDNAAIGGTTNLVSGTNAVNLGGFDNAVSNSEAINLGGDNNTTSGQASVTIGGTELTSSGTRSVAISGSANDSTSTNTVVIGGSLNTANQTNAVAIGGTSNTASGSNSVVLSGSSSSATGTRSVSIGGISNVSSGTDSLTTGQGTGASGTASSAFGLNAQASLQGEMAHAGGRFATNGDAQNRVLMVRNVTNNATPTELFLDGAAGTLRLVVPNDTTWKFRIDVAARRTDADNESAGYGFVGVIDNNAGTTALVGAVVADTPIEDTAAWACAVTASDANDALIITVTGEAAKTIRWVAKVDIVQVSG